MLGRLFSMSAIERAKMEGEKMMKKIRRRLWERIGERMGNGMRDRIVLSELNTYDGKRACAHLSLKLRLISPRVI